MPLDENNDYYLEDIHYKMNVSPLMYERCKKMAEARMQSQSSFEGLIRLFEDCGYNAQKAILKVLE